MTQEYLSSIIINKFPRLPLEGNIDLTYRCNNNCRHCWLRIPSNSPNKNKELSFEEITAIFKDAKAMGCRMWFISGGEPMLRQDFTEIFDYITSSSNTYSINTNGTLITRKIAKLMKRKGSKKVALYGSTAQVHDHITRNPGSFEATKRGLRYLKEAGAGFTVQVVPMKDNYHQFKDMVELAESLSKYYRIGAVWMWLSGYKDKERNMEIKRQRLSPQEVIELDKPDPSYEEWIDKKNSGCQNTIRGSFHFTSCINNEHSFHIDPYGKMTFCFYIKDPDLRYNLRKGSFKKCWEDFIPSLATKIKITEEYKKNCGSCDLLQDCCFCPVYGYLEHRDFNKKVEYLCDVAREHRQFKENWGKKHRRYFKIADITILVESDLPFKDNTFHPKFKPFEVDALEKDAVSIRHHFYLPDLDGKDFGKEVYRKAPWAIFKNNDFWVYLGIPPKQDDKIIYRAATFNSGHTVGKIYNDGENKFLKGNLHSLTLFPSDQILLARVLADRQGCYIHSCGVNLEGKGLLFVGHSEAGKSTMATMLKGKAEILCDDRMIIRRKPEGFKIYGTWSHGDISEISSIPVPLRAIMFLEKAIENRLIPINDKKEITGRILACLIRPFVTVDWWEKTLSVVDKIAQEIPCYVLRFDKSGRVIDVLKKL